MAFEHDIFVSYAHIDDEELRGQQWISEFHRALGIRLRQLRGEDSKIWRDPKLQGNSFFADTIKEQLAKVALFISILSPRYIKSDWCGKELNGFLAAVEKTGGLRVADKARLFKVVKTFVPVEKHPQALQPLLGYEFYEQDETGRPREFDRIYGTESENKYWAKLEDLAYDINQLLALLDEQTAEEGGEDSRSATTAGQTIYLAETTYDLEEERNKIRREFMDKGHRVIPREPLPFSPEFTGLVEAGLAESQLAIHLVSDLHCGDREGEESVADLQRKLSMARCREQLSLSATRAQGNSSFARILWTPPSVQRSQDGTEWLQGLQSDPDFLAGGLEDLKTHIDNQLLWNQLLWLVAQPRQEVGTNNSQAQIYLDCDERDLDAPEIEPLYEFLEEQFEVVTPDYKDAVITVSEETIRQCDGVLIYYRHGSGVWLKRWLRALQKTLYKRVRPLLAQAVYVAAPGTPNKQGLVAKAKVPAIVGLDAFSPELLAPFMQQLGVGV